MNVLWIAVGAVVVVVAAGGVAIMRAAAARQQPPASPDLGTVSNGWLSENRSRKDP